MELPSCLEDYEPDLVLTVDDRRNLILGLAQDGTKTIGRFITEHSDNKRSGIAKLFKHLRTRLDRQVERAREQIERRFKGRSKGVRDELDEDLERMTDGGETEGSFKSQIHREIDSRLEEILSRDAVLNLIIDLDEEQTETTRSWWARLKDAFWRLINYLKELMVRFIAWLKGTSATGKRDRSMGKQPQRMASILLNYPSGSKLNSRLDRNLNNVLVSNSDFKRVIDKDIKAAGVKKQPDGSRISWQKHFHRDRYDTEVQKAINQRIKRAIKREQRRLAHELERRRRRAKRSQKDKTQQELRNREMDSRLKQLEKQKSDELNKLKHEYQEQIDGAVQKALENELEDAGYLQKGKKNELLITSRLIDRFAEIVLSDELQKLPTKYSQKAGILGMSHGVYEKKKFRTVSDISHMDIVASLVNARLAHPTHRHIDDSDIVTHREIRSTISHVVLIFDKSGSMEENDRINAAKKAVLAIYKAVKNKNPRNIVDFIAFDSTVQVMDMLSAWHSSPSGFTNTGEALSMARRLIKDSQADHKLIYLITDGLPEAYTDKLTGKPRAGDLEKSLHIAVSEAKKLRTINRLKLTMILLEPKERIYTEAAKSVAKAAGGSVIVTDPNELVTEMLTDYIEV